MPSLERITRRRRRPLLAAAVAVVLVPGCGAQHVEADARESGIQRLEENVVDVIACVRSVVPRIDPAGGMDALGAELGGCASTDVLNKSSEFILSYEVTLPHGDGTVLFSGGLSGDRLELRLVTQGVGIADAGVASARATPATCWRLVADLGLDVIEELSETGCNEAVMTVMNPSGRVPFEDLDAFEDARAQLP